MPEPAGAHAIREIVDDIVVAWVGAGRFVGDARRHVVEPEIVAHFPSDVMIGARGVTTHAEAADELPVSIVQRQAAAEHVGPPDPLPPPPNTLVPPIRFPTIKSFGVP